MNCWLLSITTRRRHVLVANAGKRIRIEVYVYATYFVFVLNDIVFVSNKLVSTLNKYALEGAICTCILTNKYTQYAVYNLNRPEEPGNSRVDIFKSRIYIYSDLWAKIKRFPSSGRFALPTRQMA